MKTLVVFSAMFLLPMAHPKGQGTFIYDQQSVPNDIEVYEGLQTIQTVQPMGQSFTPTLNSINFIRLFTLDRNVNGVGAALFINLRSNSITGPILASTDPVAMPDGHGGFDNFFFSSLVPINPGTTLYFQPVVQSGDSWGIFHSYRYEYSGGSVFALGQPAVDYDLWFREGIYIPEPSSVSLLVIGAGALVCRRRSAAARITCPSAL
jgi:hypothetical protein